MLNLKQSIPHAKSYINSNNINSNNNNKNILHWKVSINTLIDAVL